VTAEFQWIRQLLAGDTGKAQLDGVINAVGEIQKQIDTLGPDVAGKSSLEMISNPSFRVLIQNLRQQASSLPPVAGRIVSEIADAPEANVIRSATGQVEEVYTERIVPLCTNLVANRYPFANAGTDVQLADFSRVFGYDGLFDRFFTDYLEKQVDTTGDVWTWRPGSVNPSHGLLEQIQQARRIRDMFFSPGSKAPELKFSVTSGDLDPNARRFVLTIDGVITDDQHPNHDVTWPGTAGGRVLLAFESRYYDPPWKYDGPWGLFKMIDNTRAAVPDPQRILLNVLSPHHRVRVTIEPRAGVNPLASGSWRRFVCES
jgi:type VI secretion system protein ImpL